LKGLEFCQTFGAGALARSVIASQFLLTIFFSFYAFLNVLHTPDAVLSRNLVSLRGRTRWGCWCV